MIRSTRLLIVALTLGAAVAGCATRSPNIADIKYNPGRYYDRTVSVQGVVRRAWDVPMVPFRVYQIEDQTGAVTVVSQSPRVPPPGVRVQVTGTVEDVASLGGRSIGLHIREDHLRILRP
jgi:hypothetical protein